MSYQISSGASNQMAKFVRLTLQTNDLAPLTSWRRELQKGVSKKQKGSDSRPSLMGSYLVSTT